MLECIVEVRKEKEEWDFSLFNKRKFFIGTGIMMSTCPQTLQFANLEGTGDNV